MTLAEFFFSGEGRINREQFWLRCLLLNIELYFLWFSWYIEISIPVFITLSLLIICSFICAIVKRLCDIDKSGFNVFWIVVLPIGLIYLIFVCVLTKSSEGTNKYGESPPELIFDFDIRNQKELYGQILVILVVCILLILASLME